MADVNKIHTTLPMTLNREYYDEVNENFSIIKQALMDANNQIADLQKQLQASQQEKSSAVQLINQTDMVAQRTRTTMRDINN